MVAEDRVNRPYSTDGPISNRGRQLCVGPVRTPARDQFSREKAGAAMCQGEGGERVTIEKTTAISSAWKQQEAQPTAHQARLHRLQQEHWHSSIERTVVLRVAVRSRRNETPSGTFHNQSLT